MLDKLFRISPFCPQKRGYASLPFVYQTPKRWINFIYIGYQLLLIIDVFPHPLEHQMDSYFFNQVISRLLELNCIWQHEMELFWFDSLEQMEKALDWEWEDLIPECKLIVVLIG